MPKILCR